MVSTVQKTVEDPAEIPLLQILDKFYDMPVVVQRQVSMVLTVQRPVEIPQVHFLGKVVDMLVCCATGAHGLNCAENRSVSTVAVHRQIRRQSCGCFYNDRCPWS